MTNRHFIHFSFFILLSAVLILNGCAKIGIMARADYGTPTIWASGSCSSHMCEYKQESHRDPKGNTMTVHNSNIGTSVTSWVNVSVEKGPPTNLSQYADTRGGIPDHYGCSTKWYDSFASIDVGGTRTEVIWGENCSMDGSTGLAIAFIEQEHYVTVFISGATSSATLSPITGEERSSILSNDTTLTGILSGISWVSSKPWNTNENTRSFSINKNTRNVKCKITPFVKSTNLSKKEYLESIGLNKPKSKEDAEFCFLFSDNFSDQFRRDAMELHDKLFEIIGAYDRFVYYVYTLDGDNEEAISILNEIGVWGGNITSIDQVFERRSCLSAFWRFADFAEAKLNEYSFCNWPDPFEHTPWIANEKNKNIARYEVMNGWAHEYFHHFQRAHTFERALGMSSECCGLYNPIEAPAWWVEGAALVFPNYFLKEIYPDLSLTKENNFPTPKRKGHDGSVEDKICSAFSSGGTWSYWIFIYCDEEGVYGKVKKSMMGQDPYGGNIKCSGFCVECKEFTAKEESRDTRKCGVGGSFIANVYLAYITSYETMFFGILEDSWEIGFPASFEKHVGMTMDEFYVQFTKFMREGNIDDPPPQGFFPKEPLSKLVDFSSVDSG